jgi:hypothetical protein
VPGRARSAPPRRRTSSEPYSSGYEAADLDALAGHCADRLAARLSRPQRDASEWPLAKDGRRHVYIAIDADELPVRHETRRRGHPYTLVLTETESHFEAERQEPARDRADAAWFAAA